MNDHPLISVLIPVYNGSKHLAACIESVLAQTFTDFELVIVDDGSTDDSPEIVRTFAAQDARIRFIPVPHGGRCRARNIAIAAARGQLIAWQDMDDLSLPTRLEVELEWMRKYKLDIVGSCAKYIGTRNNMLWFPQNHADIQHELLFRASLLQPTTLLRADIARQNLYDEQVSFEDYEMWVRLAPYFRMGNVPQVLFLYRSHETQSHILESIEFQADLRELSKKHFVSLFPESTQSDRETIAGLVARQPAPGLVQLKNAGLWLIRLSQSQDSFFRKKMLGRWRGACKRAAFMGWGVYRLYHELVPAFHQPPQPFQAALFFMCLLRLRSDSRLFTAVNAWRQSVLRKIRAFKLRRIKSFSS